MKEKNLSVYESIINILEHECATYLVYHEGRRIYIPLTFAPVLTRILFQKKLVTSISFTKSFCLFCANEDVVPLVRVSYL